MRNQGPLKIALYVSEHGWIKTHEDTPCGRGYTVFTKNPDEALTFPSAVEALEFWRQQSKTVPLRPDGKPNRPLTAFSAEVMPITEKPILP